jgi:hypothetical protein
VSKDRVVQDSEIAGMMEFIKGAGWGETVADALVVMLEELLVLRKKVRADA